MSIEKLTFTGVDQWADLGRLAALAAPWPRVEFGALVGGKTGTRAAPSRFPDWSLIERLRHLEACCALHLCGRYANNAQAEDCAPACAVAGGFDRVQVNAVRYKLPQIVNFAHQVSCRPVILQRRQASASRDLHPKVEYLFDLSGGRGEATHAAWAEPLSGRRWGYAGGLGPDNLEPPLAWGHRHVDQRLWFDMESGVRDAADHFDLDAVERVCTTVFAAACA